MTHCTYNKYTTNINIKQQHNNTIAIKFLTIVFFKVPRLSHASRLTEGHSKAYPMGIYERVNWI